MSNNSKMWLGLLFATSGAVDLVVGQATQSLRDLIAAALAMGIAGIFFFEMDRGRARFTPPPADRQP